MLFLKFLFYAVINFSLLGFRFGIALIVTVIAWSVFIVFYSKYISSDGKEFTECAIMYLTFYIYAMWAIGAVWRLLKLKQAWKNFKGRRDNSQMK